MRREANAKGYERPVVVLFRWGKAADEPAHEDVRLAKKQTDNCRTPLGSD